MTGNTVSLNKADDDNDEVTQRIYTADQISS